MPRLQPIERNEAPEDALEYYDRDEARYGAVLNNTKLYAHNVIVLRAMKELGVAFADMRSLPLWQKALIRARVAGLNGCPFWTDLNSAVGRDNGVSDEKLLELNAYESSEYYDEPEKLALQYADKITKSTEDVEDELFARLTTHYSPAELVELTFTIAYENFLSKFHRALRIESQGFCAVTPRPSTT
jgi:alkylhydroperoxidase family enzyme